MSCRYSEWHWQCDKPRNSELTQLAWWQQCGGESCASAGLNLPAGSCKDAPYTGYTCPAGECMCLA
jgi:hypothetical protein